MSFSLYYYIWVRNTKEIKKLKICVDIVTNINTYFFNLHNK